MDPEYTMTIRLSTRAKAWLVGLLLGWGLAIPGTGASAMESAADMAPSSMTTNQAATLPGREERIQTLLAQVGDTPITVGHLWEYVKKNPYLIGIYNSVEGKIQALKGLIEARLINLAAIERAELKPDASQDDLVQAIADLEREAFAPDEVTDEQLQAAYARRRDTLGIPSAVRIREIFFPVPAGADEAERAAVYDQAVGALRRAQAGEPFEALASELAHLEALRSLGGDQGYLPLYQYPYLENLTRDMRQDDLGEVQELPNGYHIFQFIDRREAVLASFEQVRARLSAEMMAESQARKKAEFVSDYAAKVGVVIHAPELRAAWPIGEADAASN
jgi:parvulin-like peptidyl-prolyl isomerase